MPDFKQRTLTLVGLALALFGISVITLLKLVPEPRSGIDYLMIGSVSTLLALTALFIIIIGNEGGFSALFAKRKKKAQE